MKKLVYPFILAFLFFSCKKNSIPKTSNVNKVLVEKCYVYVGTPYQFGGASKSGMDCSGLIFTAFKEVGKDIPRVSYKQAEYFEEIKKDDINVGDLIYFKVKSSRINHTGIISRIENKDEIYFLHASTSLGVREDNLLSKYWMPKFVKATRPSI
ncbi:NlpC/P60 family protein [Lacihabitans sp. LS3-19]|uniref:C40 family peptidase n=1 Tax=Lacihabitans sp. LS3-19 TaxID=2487335 RepID=UPI0020CEC0CA|nr:C40 family peptidase [Lacihabitans sp. LS3-19]MCP9769982.1 NlpC/P60 family protein [Lacihabitans sp. LS3-19]